MSTGHRCFVIAEAGVNHNGSPEMAHRLVDQAAAAGVDAIKFQTFRAEAVVTASAPKAAYQTKTTGEGTQIEMIRRLELGNDVFRELADHARERGLEFMSTPFDQASLAFLVETLDVARLKIASGELTNGPLLLAAAATARPIILSTGMSTEDEIADALGVLAFGYLGEQRPSPEAFAAARDSQRGAALLRDRVTLLHCTTEYPAPLEEVNLRAMARLTERFGLPVGYSDHTLGTTVAVAAAALGAVVVEKHFTLDRGLPGPDHAASLEPEELAAMVRAIRDVEKALGTEQKAPTPAERKNLAAARRSLVAARPIRAGEILDETAIAAKRPATGLSPMRYWSVLGRVAPRDFSPDEPIEL